MNVSLFRVKFSILAIILYFVSIESLKLERHHNFLQGDVQQFRQAQLQLHNELRRNHQAGDLELDENLNNIAQQWAEHLAQSDLFEHSNGGYGQNLYYVWAQPERAYENGAATQSWYDQIGDYDFGNPGFSMQTGHFTQVIWRGTQRVGFGIASKNGNDYVVAQYDPPGNYLGDFQDNVLQA